MRILTSMPGRFGDIGWALPSCRAIAEANEPVDLVIGAEFAAIVPLLQQQPYLRHVWSDPTWHLVPPDEWRAPYAGKEGVAPPDAPTEPYDRVIHLGHRRWPDESLPKRIHTQLGKQYPDLQKAPLDLDRPWITLPPHATGHSHTVAVCWSEEWIELKMGTTLAVADSLLYRPSRDPADFVLVTPDPPGRRAEWERVWLWLDNTSLCACDWLGAAAALSRVRVVLTCCSGLWVLANALNKPVVLYEPSAARQNPVFWLDHPRNRKVLGGDGQPTIDARATATAIEAVLDGL